MKLNENDNKIISLIILFVSVNFKKVTTLNDILDILFDDDIGSENFKIKQEIVKRFKNYTKS